MKRWSWLAGLVLVLAPGTGRAGGAGKQMRGDLAFVLLATPVMPPAQEVVKAFASFAPKEPPLRVELPN